MILLIKCQSYIYIDCDSNHFRFEEEKPFPPRHVFFIILSLFFLFPLSLSLSLSLSLLNFDVNLSSSGYIWCDCIPSHLKIQHRNREGSKVLVTYPMLLPFVSWPRIKFCDIGSPLTHSNTLSACPCKSRETTTFLIVTFYDFFPSFPYPRSCTLLLRNVSFHPSFSPWLFTRFPSSYPSLIPCDQKPKGNQQLYSSHKDTKIIGPINSQQEAGSSLFPSPTFSWWLNRWMLPLLLSSQLRFSISCLILLTCWDRLSSRNTSITCWDCSVKLREQEWKRIWETVWLKSLWNTLEPGLGLNG